MKSLIVAEVARPEPRKFPKLMKSDNTEVVYLVSKDTDTTYNGVVLSDPNHVYNDIGFITPLPDMAKTKDFHDFVGTIQLMND